MTYRALHQRTVDESLDSAKRRIDVALAPVDSLTLEQVRDIIGTYRVAIEPNFIPWMQIAYETARSGVAKRVILENIGDEISQDHPSMLRNFATSSGVELRTEHYTKASKPVLDMWKLIDPKDGLTNVAIAATLENTSLVFIPYLAMLGKRARCQDFTYTDVHGEADIEHAQELHKGLVEEMQLANLSQGSVLNTVDKTTRFLGRILTP